MCCTLLSLQVMDMCASPGSKTAQLLEALHQGDGLVRLLNQVSSRRITILGILFGSPMLVSPVCCHVSIIVLVMCTQPTGYVVANDVDPKRAYMLVAQCQRVSSSNLIGPCTVRRPSPSRLCSAHERGVSVVCHTFCSSQ